MKRILLAVFLLFIFVGCKSKDMTGNMVLDSEQETAQLDECEDTDNGIDDSQKGYVSGRTDGDQFNLVDRCIAGLLIEYYCEGSKPLNRNLRCDGACSDGACV